MFTALTIISAFIKLPLPIIPASLQPLIVILSGALLGSRMGALSQILYLILGLIGLPVFTQGGGVGYLLKPSFGFIIGFIAGSYVIGKIIESRKNKNMSTFLLANITGLFAIYFFGVSYMYLLLNHVLDAPISLYQAIQTGALLFLPKDLLIVAFITIVAQRIFKQVHQFRTS